MDRQGGELRVGILPPMDQANGEEQAKLRSMELKAM